MERLLTAPFIESGSADVNVRPHLPAAADGHPVLRVGFWNIERGLNYSLIQAALSGRDDYRRQVISHGREQDRLVDVQLERLRDVDVLILNEADWGMKRTGYANVAHDLALALHMNYAYGVEFVEVDPVFELGTETVHLRDSQQDKHAQLDLTVDHTRYRGLHGTAILSRYPIEHARILRLPRCYDWYGSEYRAISRLEQGRRWSAHKLFGERVERELRHGGRMALIADIAVPELPSGSATVVATHLENKCGPSCRLKQMQALLANIQDDSNPVILAGDLNTTSGNNTLTSIRNELMSRVTDYKFWIGSAVSWFHPLGTFKYALFPVRYLHGYNDPTAWHLPILWDNRERPLFAA